MHFCYNPQTYKKATRRKRKQMKRDSISNHLRQLLASDYFDPHHSLSISFSFKICS